MISSNISGYDRAYELIRDTSFDCPGPCGVDAYEELCELINTIATVEINKDINCHSYDNSLFYHAVTVQPNYPDRLLKVIQLLLKNEAIVSEKALNYADRMQKEGRYRDGGKIYNTIINARQPKGAAQASNSSEDWELLPSSAAAPFEFYHGSSSSSSSYSFAASQSSQSSIVSLAV